MLLIENKRILVLPSWYPSKVDIFNGDFIQRHIAAISIYCRQDVIFIIKDEMGNITKDVLIEEKTAHNLTEKIIYYYLKKTGVSFLDKLLSQRKYKQLYKKAINDYINKIGLPDLVHVHIAMKAGLQALWIKKKWKIPFVLSEHWTAYLPEADLTIKDFSFVYRRLLREIFKQATMLSVVSDYLGKALQQAFIKPHYIKIANVVDTNIFFPADKKLSSSAKFIHVSNMNYQKNTEAIIEALKYCKDRGDNFEMLLYGPIKPSLQKLVNDLSLDDCIFFKGEVPQPELAKAMQQADALILYSRFETFGCVLIEANACGTPVIVNSLEVFHEIIEEGLNGSFVKQDNIKALAEKLVSFIQHKEIFNREKIALAAAEKYNYNTIGKQFAEWYEQALNEPMF
jgi:glycosyltransferase involved in cell wall biosynthesis